MILENLNFSEYFQVSFDEIFHAQPINLWGEAKYELYNSRVGVKGKATGHELMSTAHENIGKLPNILVNFDQSTTFVTIFLLFVRKILLIK